MPGTRIKEEHASKDISQQSSKRLPSSQGDTPRHTLNQEVAEDMHEEFLLDEAIRESFPASDPVEQPADFMEEKMSACEAAEDVMLDSAIEMTFPASDPIAVDSCADIIREHKEPHVEPYHPPV